METGFRNNAAFGDGVIEADKIIAYEIFELGNSDILRYVLDNFKPQNSDDMFLITDIKTYIDELEENGYVDDLYTSDKEAFAQKIVEYVSRQSGIDVKYALWLCDSKDDVLENYGCDWDTEDDISEYPKTSAIFSYLGSEGGLYGYDVDPYTLEIEKSAERES